MGSSSGRRNGLSPCTGRWLWKGPLGQAEKQVEAFLAGGGEARRRRTSLIMDSSRALLFPQTLAQILWAISSAISVAYFALSGIAAQLLNALGLEGEWQRTG